jgi:ribosomal protein S20
LFTRALESNSVQEKVKTFVKSYNSNEDSYNDYNIDKLVQEFNDIIYSACEKSLKKVKISQNEKKVNKKIGLIQILIKCINN